MDKIDANVVSPQDLEDVRHMQLVRVKYGLPMQCHYLSEEPLCLKIHYYDGRSWLHEKEDCPHCEKSPWTKIESYSLIRYRGQTCILALPARATYALHGVMTQLENGIQFRELRLERKRSDKGPIAIYVNRRDKCEELSKYLANANLSQMVGRILSG